MYMYNCPSPIHEQSSSFKMVARYSKALVNIVKRDTRTTCLTNLQIGTFRSHLPERRGSSPARANVCVDVRRPFAIVLRTDE